MATTTRVSPPARRPSSRRHPSRSWVPMVPETPTSWWMLAKGTPALRSCSSWLKMSSREEAVAALTGGAGFIYESGNTNAQKLRNATAFRLFSSVP